MSLRSRLLVALVLASLTSSAWAQAGDCNGNCIQDSVEIAQNFELDVASPGPGGTLVCGANGILDACEGLAPTGQEDLVVAPLGVDAFPYVIGNDPVPVDVEPDSVQIVTGSQHGLTQSGDLTSLGYGPGHVRFLATLGNCWTHDSFTYRYARLIQNCPSPGQVRRVWSAPIRVDVTVLPPTQPFADCNRNCLDDANESGADCDFDGTLDLCEMAQDPSLDCDRDGALDACQINGATDQDGNGVLDVCEIRALVLDAAAPIPAHVRVTDTAALRLNTLTVESWVWWDASAPAPATILSRWGDSGLNDRSYALGLEPNGEVQFSLSRTNTQQDGVYHDFRAGNVPRNGWHHVAGTYDGATRRIYVDGVLRGSLATVGPVHPGTTDLSLGVQIANDATGVLGSPLGGRIDEVRIWSYARSETEIRASMPLRIRSNSALPGLVGVWALDGSVAATVGGHASSFGGTSPNFVAGAPATIAVPCCEPFGRDCSTIVASASSLGVTANDSSGSTGGNFLETDGGAAISGDGGTVAFWSLASNLVQGDSNSCSDVFVRDLTTGTTERVSVSSTGAQSSTTSSQRRGVALDATGTLVAFASDLPGLVACDTNNQPDVFVRDLTTGLTTRVSQTAAGVQGNFGSERPALSSNGRFVVFQSTASNLVTGDTNNNTDVFLVDRTLSTIQRVSTQGATQGNQASYDAAISGDGTIVAFTSLASNFVSGDLSFSEDVFVRLPTGVLELVSVPVGASSGQSSGYPSLSSTGRYVAFASYRSNLVSNDTNGSIEDVFVRDRTLGTTELVSLSSAGLRGNAGSTRPAISSDGRFVAFRSSASNLVPDDTNGVDDVFVRDRLTGETRRVSLGAQGAQGLRESGDPRLSDDGQHVVFTTLAHELGTQSSVGQVVVRSCEPVVPIPVCLGDGTGVACPCGNFGAPGHGCEHSFGTGGALLSSAGETIVSADRFRLDLSGLPPTLQTPTFFEGRTLVNSTFGDGVRCAGGTTVRLGSRVTTTGAVSFGFGIAGDPLISVQAGVPTLGATRWYQASYRNSIAFCTPATFNVSNALQVSWAP